MLKFEFQKTNEKTEKAFNEQVKNLYEEMEVVVNGNASENEVLEYCIVALKSAMRISKDMYMWGLDEPKNMPSDARVDFLYVPTYIISGIIMYSFQTYKKVRDFEPLAKFIPKYLNGCMGRNFMGHGYEALDGFNTTMSIFEKCRVKEFVEVYPEMNKEFTREYLAANEYWNRMKGNNKLKGWYTSRN